MGTRTHRRAVQRRHHARSDLTREQLAWIRARDRLARGLDAYLRTGPPPGMRQVVVEVEHSLSAGDHSAGLAVSAADEPRLLHRRSQFGYTDRPECAMLAEPEAVSRDEQDWQTARLPPHGARGATSPVARASGGDRPADRLARDFQRFDRDVSKPLRTLRRQLDRTRQVDRRDAAVLVRTCLGLCPANARCHAIGPHRVGEDQPARSISSGVSVAVENSAPFGQRNGFARAGVD